MATVPSELNVSSHSLCRQQSCMVATVGVWPAVPPWLSPSGAQSPKAPQPQMQLSPVTPACAGVVRGHLQG